MIFVTYLKNNCYTAMFYITFVVYLFYLLIKNITSWV